MASQGVALSPKAAQRDVDSGVTSALKSRSSGDFKAAFATLSRLASAHPKSARVHHELGVLYALHGQFEAAGKRFSAALTLDPKMVAARRGLAEVLRAADRCPRALVHYAQLAKSPSQRPVALRGLALCRTITGDDAGATAALEQLTRDFSDTAPGRWAAATLAAMKAAPAGQITAAQAEREGLRHFRLKQYARAASWFEYACQHGPTADRCYRLGVAHLGQRSFLAAAIAFRRALLKNPKHLPTLSAWPTAAKLLRKQGGGGVAADFVSAGAGWPAKRVAEALLNDDLLLAEQLASATIKSGHKGRVVRLLRAECRIRRGQLRSAERDLQAVLRGRPGLTVAKHALAAVYVALGQFSQARTMAGLQAPQSPPPGVRWPKPPNDDLRAFVRWRRAAINHSLRRLSDAGLKPFPAFSPPPVPNPESIRGTTRPSSP
ncbi:MAG: hypothetical protein KC502_03445 [Myxococcales bacterium]|nr:hypothetical protein [Myxococcales bacterium]